MLCMITPLLATACGELGYVVSPQTQLAAIEGGEMVFGGDIFSGPITTPLMKLPLKRCANLAAADRYLARL